jgi:hypothetical protein
MNSNNLRPVIQDILKETLGNDVYIPNPISARLKTGQRVIRVIGSSPYYHDSLFKRKEGNSWAIEHVAQRIDGKVREQVEVTTNTNFKVRYESYEEVRAALLEEGINVDQLPLLTDMRPPEGQERN